tara:strand:+ start:12276 stop:13127 length:852 start_codon:yes stop_codon:yes gene_type:complete
MATAVTNISKAIATIQGEAVYNFNDVNVCLPLITSAQAPQGAGNVNFPIYNQPAHSDADGSENTAGTDFGVTASTQVCTPSRKGIHTTLSDEASVGGAGVVSSIGSVLGNAVAQKFDADVCALFPNLNGGTDVGTTNTALSLAVFFAGMKAVKSSGASAPYSFVSNAGGIWGTNGLRPLLLDTSNTGLNSTTPANEYASTGFVTQIGLTKVFSSEGVIEAGNDVKAGLFGKSAVVCGIGAQGLLRVEQQRNATKGAWEVVASGFYDVQEGQDSHGIMVLYKKD